MKTRQAIITAIKTRIAQLRRIEEACAFGDADIRRSELVTLLKWIRATPTKKPRKRVTL